MITLKKIFIFLLVIIFFVSENLPAYAGNVYALAPQYLCELGIKFYQRGRFDDALHELRKALILKPDDETAKRYINLIEEQLKPAPVIAPVSVEEVPEKPLIEKVTPPVKEIAPAEKIPLEIAPEKPAVKKLPEKPPIEKAVPLVKAPPVAEKVPEKPQLVVAPKEKPVVVEKAPSDKARLKTIQRLLDKLEKKKEKEEKKIRPAKKEEAPSFKKTPEKPAIKKPPEEPPIEIKKAPPVIKAPPKVEKVPVAITPKEPAAVEKVTPPVKEITPVEKIPVEKAPEKPAVKKLPEKSPIEKAAPLFKVPPEVEEVLEKPSIEPPMLKVLPPVKVVATVVKPTPPVKARLKAMEKLLRKLEKEKKKIVPAKKSKPAVKKLPEKPPIEKAVPLVKAPPVDEKVPKKPALIVAPEEKPVAVEKIAPKVKAPTPTEKLPVEKATLEKPPAEKPLVVEVLPEAKIQPPTEKLPKKPVAVEKPSLIEEPPVVKAAPPVKTRPEVMQELLEKLEKERKKMPPVKRPEVKALPPAKKPPEKPPIEKAVPVIKAPPVVEKVPLAITPKEPAVVEKVTPPVKEITPVEKIPIEKAPEKPSLVEARKLLLPKKEVSLKEGIAPEVIILDERIKTLKFPLEIEKGKSLIIRGKNIKRFLVTQPNTLNAERINQNEILVTGKDIGYTYLHAWDDNGRWTLDFLTTSPKPKGPTYEEVMRKEQERAANFKLRYSLGWSSFETGRRLDSLERTSFSYNHLLSLFGPIPYGDLDSYMSVRTLEETTDLTYFTLGLEKGKFNSFKDFSLRTFDYSPGVTNLSFSNPRLRGVVFKSPAFEKKIDYTVLWGREGGGRFGNLSPGIAKIKDSFISGIAANFSPKKRQNHSFSIFSGWGRDRPADLNPFGYDLSADYGFKQWGMGYELAYDSQELAYLLNADFNLPKLKFTTEFRNTDKNFKTMTAGGWRRGEIGLLSTLTFKPSEKMTIGSRLDIFQDRLFPNPANIRRPNQDFDWDVNYTIDPLTNLRLDYSLQNDLGRVSALRSQNAGIGLYRTIEFVRRINVFANYRHRESKFFTSHASDFINDKINLGLRFSLFPDLYYYLNKELNWIEERQAANHSHPSALETGVDWNSRLFKSPFYTNLRFTYRDEEDTVAPLSFLSGEDYIEGFADLSYRPKPDIEAFCSVRIRNIWADNPNIRKRIDASFNAGMRYLWNTGVRWESKGNIEGYVFKDLNSDGLRQRDESPVEGIKLWLGKDRFQTTDTFGYYKFKGVRAAKAYVAIDTSTLPAGFVLTVPAIQQTDIVHNQSVRLDFGISSRSEITGFVFEDSDADGVYGKDDTGIKGAVLTLEDGKKAITDGNGKYTFAHLAPGEQAITLDLNSLPIYYLPQVAITKKINLFEGVSYIYNIPLKRVENKPR